MIKHTTKFLALGSLLCFLSPADNLLAADMPERIQAATEILDQKQNSPNPIPIEIRNNAKAIAVFSVTKAGLGIGGRGGEGLIVVRLGDAYSHTWSAPSAFNLGGPSIGAQVGFSESRYIVILNTDEAVRHFTSAGKMMWDASASGTAGTDTATEKASTSDLQKRDVIVYKDADGLFGGATLGGTSIERKDEINQKAYGTDVLMGNILNGTVQTPKSADRLYLLLNKNA